jgi:predicted nuclease with TOPRIM domain
MELTDEEKVKFHWRCMVNNIGRVEEKQSEQCRKDILAELTRLREERATLRDRVKELEGENERLKKQIERYEKWYEALKANGLINETIIGDTHD